MTQKTNNEGFSLQKLLRPHVRGIVIRQIFIQLFLLLMTAIVLFPVLWIISMAVDPRGITRPTDLNLFPANATLKAFERLLTEPFSNVLPLYFSDMLLNSLFIALGVSVFTVVLGSPAAYAFSRFRFMGRQSGMLGFIILLMLPATGIIVPLFVMFTAVKINSTVAAAPPAFFTGGIVAALIFVAYSLVKTYGKHDPSRSFNISQRLVVAISSVGVLIAVAATFFVMLVRHPVYDSQVAQVLKNAENAFLVVDEEYKQRVDSVAQRTQTAEIREQRAEFAAQESEAMTALLTSAQEASDADMKALLSEEITAREAGENPEDDIVLQAAVAAQTALEAGNRDGALEALAQGAEAANEEATKRQDSAVGARDNVTEAQTALTSVTATHEQALATFEAEQERLNPIAGQAMTNVVPWIILAWIAAMLVAYIALRIIYLLRGQMEVETILNVLLWIIMIGVTISIGLVALDTRVGDKGGETETLRTTLLGLSIAFASGGLPFAIWNLKGYFDTIPKEIEEAALIDGAGRISTFFRVMVPLSLPAFAIVILFSFMNGWMEFILSWVFLTGKIEDYTLAMALATLANGANTAPPDMQKFGAMAILISIPVLILFFSFQRWIVGGLSIGGVKG